jgi:3-hydroxybutyrate dehydrogenase
MQRKVALITGSTSGIGLGLATALAAQGHHVVLNGLGDLDEIESLRRDLEKRFDVQALYSSADMSAPTQIQQMVLDVERQLGSVDILINNAGIQHVAPLDEFPTAKWDAILAINLSSNFHTIHATLPMMKKRNWGRIINIASAHGLVASPFKSAYVAAKHGVIGLTKTVALEVAETAITCNAICPGYVRTPLVERQISEQAQVHHMSETEVIQKVLLAAQPKKSFVEVEQVAALTLFLCSDAAAMITGAALPMDGGWTAR